MPAVPDALRHLASDLRLCVSRLDLDAQATLLRTATNLEAEAGRIEQQQRSHQLSRSPSS